MTKKELEKKVEELTSLVNSLLEENKKLKAELKKYKNPNTPPSSNKHMKPNTRGKDKKKRKKRGAPKGHKGKTRIQNPSRKEIIDADKCTQCGSKKVEDKKIHNKIVEEIPEPVLPETVEYEIHEKRCNHCGHIFIPEECPVPLNGKFGYNVMILVVFMKYFLRGVLRKIVLFLNIGYRLKLAPASIGAILTRVSRAAENEYDELKKRIRSAARVYVDETSFSVLGKNSWAWVFRTANEMLLVIDSSRGRDVLLEILGDDFEGVVICDCWRAYDHFKRLQRCWSHLLRKAKKIDDSLVAENFHKKLKSLFKEIKRFNGRNQSKKSREKKYNEMTLKLGQLVKYYEQYENMHEVTTYISNNIENWFTCIKYENVEPTNNYAEQSIRETVIIRKIIGAFRSERGPEEYSRLASLLASWKMQGCDIALKLKKMLVKHSQTC
jgi:transposase